MNYVESFNLLGVEAKQIPCIKGEGAPTTATEGAIGCFYMDTTIGTLYKCTAVESGNYTWGIFEGEKGDPGTDGTNGVIFIPSVSADGTLSWTNDGGLTNPDPVNIVANAESIGEIVQTTGDSETTVMSQKAVTDEFNKICEVVESVNLFDKNSDENRNGYIVQKNATSLTAIAGFTLTHPMEAKIGTYTFHTNSSQLGVNAVSVAPCNSNGELVPRSKQATDNGNGTATITIDENWGASHFAVNVYNKDIDAFMVVKGDTMPSVYTPYEAPKTKLKAEAMPDGLISEEMVANALNANSPLYGKKISLNGDSICYGAGSTGGYGAILAERNNMTLQNVARSGGTIAAETYGSDGTTARHWICRTIANMDSNSDYAIVEGGVNDASVKPPLGAISSGLKSTLDDTTFYGAFESMLKQLTLRFAGKKIGYIMVHQMHEDFSPIKADNYYWAAKKCCEKWGVPFLDLSISCPPFGLIFPSNTEMYPLRETYTSNADGWHPNEEGYRKFYVPKIEAWLKTL